MLIFFLSLLATSNGNIDQCLEDWGKVLSSIYDNWHNGYTKMLYYTGKSLNDLGRYHKCTDIPEAKYALIEFYKPPWFTIALCGPKTCSKADYYEIFNSSNNVINFYLDSIIPDFPNNNTNIYFPQEEGADLKMDTGRIFMFIIVSMLIILGFIGTSISLKYKDSGIKGSEYFMCFSVYDNLKNLSLRKNEDRLGTIRFDFLDGVRVMCVCWVMLGHIVMQISIYSIIGNIFDLENKISQPSITMVYGGYYAVDTNFWISGFLGGYFIMKMLSGKKFSWFYVYLHRYIRVTILFVFTTMMFWAFEKFMGAGPLWFLSGQYTKDCYDYWWTTLLYVNNFVPEFKGNSCGGVGWFLAEDMQFFLVTPPILYVFSKYSQKLGWILIGLLVIVPMGATAAIAEYNNLNMVMISEEDRNLISYYYVKPYCRATPYAFGLACGILVYNQYREPWKIYMYLKSRNLRFLIFALALLMINFLIFIQFTAYHYPGKDFRFSKWSQSENTAWMSLNKFFYSLSISSIFLPCLLGYYPWIQNILSYRLWTPFAKLTFAVYLIHLYIIDIIFKSQNISLYFSNLTIVSSFIPIVVICYFSALPIVLLVEIPAAKIEKMHRESFFSKKLDSK